MRIATRITRLTSVGWLYSLRRQRNSNWGEVDLFYSDVLRGAKPPVARCQSTVWGTFRNAGPRPQHGDGIAFYHSSRAGFPQNDNHGRMPRVSLLARIVGVQWQGRNIGWIDFEFDVDLARALRSAPILSSGAMKGVFEDIGLVSGSVATMYPVASPQWKRLRNEALRRSK